ncbi:MAG: hypothetical protein ABSC06_15175 [Rhodopila sp.]
MTRSTMFWQRGSLGFGARLAVEAGGGGRDEAAIGRDAAMTESVATSARGSTDDAFRRANSCCSAGK